MSAITEYLRRATAPRIVVATSRWRAPQRIRARVGRAFGTQPSIELFFAFDDPYSAIALPGLIEIARARNAHLKLRPLLERGIDGDPAQQQRRIHAVSDSRRLAQRDGRRLGRHAPLSANDCEFLAHWSAAAQHHAKINDFIAAALAQLWFTAVADTPPNAADFIALHVKHLGIAPPTIRHASTATLAHNRARLLRLGHWESPVAHVGGEWFFAHERLPQIDACLNSLGA